MTKITIFSHTSGMAENMDGNNCQLVGLVFGRSITLIQAEVAQIFLMDCQLI